MTVLHSITVVCPRLLTVGDSVVLFVFLFFLILYGAPAMSLTITDKNAIVQKFNDFLVNIGPILATNTNHKEYLSGDYPDSFALFLTTPQEVIKATNELANKTSAGYDNISVNIVKKIIHHIADPLSTLINKSFEYGIVPDQLKIARVCPIF